jgi:hypothetical protein
MEPRQVPRIGGEWKTEEFIEIVSHFDKGKIFSSM